MNRELTNLDAFSSIEDRDSPELSSLKLFLSPKDGSPYGWAAATREKHNKTAETFD